MVIEQIEKKILSGADLTTLTDSELSQIAIQFVGDAPPSHVPRETVIDILSGQESVVNWQNNLLSKAKELANQKMAEAVTNVQNKIEDNSDNPMAKMIRERFGKWLHDSGYGVTELTTKLDRNADGVIDKEEISQFIVEITGNKPPDWVLEHVSNILDSNNDGIILVSELWDYLEEIGFNVPVIENLLDDEPVLDPVIDEFEQLDNELKQDVEIVASVTEVIPKITVIEEEVVAEKKIQDPAHEIETTENEASISTGIEKNIELLEKSRLHSDANTIIANSKPGKGSLKVERIERNLMVSDNYRGGKTLIGPLDNGPFTVAVLFEPEFNDLIESSNKSSQVFSFEANLFEWSSGLRRAKLKGFNLTVVD